jgi:hypothetical protein
VEEDHGVIELEALDKNGQPLNFLYVHASIVTPDLSASESELIQIGPGRYQAEVTLSQPGTYLVRLGVNDGDISLGQQILGMVVPFSPEYRISRTDLPLLAQLARVTGGSELTEPVSAFVHNLEATAKAHEIWQPLLLIVAFLFPLDVAIRRVMLGHSDFEKAKIWLQTIVPSRKQKTAPEERVMGGLFKAREQARRRQARSSKGESSEGREQNQIREKELGVRQDERHLRIPDSQPSNVPASDSSGETLSRLKDAKKRVRRDE